MSGVTLSITFRHGRKPPHPESTHPRVKLGLAVDKTALPAPPATVDWYTSIVDWPMYANSDWGDCVEAEMGHHEEALTFYGSGKLVKVADSDVLAVYSAVTGFDPNAGKPGSNPTDQGTVIQDALSYYRKVGIAGRKIAAFAEVNVKDITEVKTALALFGPLSIGVNFPASAMQQFNDAEPWDVVADDGGIDGGHCVALVGYDATYYYVITWGAVQQVTPAWWAKYVEEAWTPISAEWISAQTGLDPKGVDLSALGDQFASLTGQANPFPGPAPEPQPTPQPGPAPDPAEPADEVLAAVVRPWLKYRHRGANADVAHHLKAWLSAKNL